MKIIFMLSLFFIFGCTSRTTQETSSWSGAQRQEAIDDTTHTQRQEQFRNQNPHARRDF